MMSGSGTRCAACKYLRRRCDANCILAPYFPPSDPDRFACVHRIFGASNVSRMLQEIPTHQRGQAADAISFEAFWRERNPVYGCAGVISMLQQEIRMAQLELAETRAWIAMNCTQLQIKQHQQLLQQQQQQPPPVEAKHSDVEINERFGLEAPSFGSWQQQDFPFQSAQEGTWKRL